MLLMLLLLLLLARMRGRRSGGLGLGPSLMGRRRVSRRGTARPRGMGGKPLLMILVIVVLLVVGKTGGSLMRALLLLRMRLVVIVMLLLVLLLLMMLMMMLLLLLVVVGMIYWHGGSYWRDDAGLVRMTVLIAVVDRVGRQRVRGRQLLRLLLGVEGGGGGRRRRLVKGMRVGQRDAGEGGRRLLKLLGKGGQTLELRRIKSSDALMLMIEGWEIRRRRRSGHDPRHAMIMQTRTPMTTTPTSSFFYLSPLKARVRQTSR